MKYNKIGEQIRFFRKRKNLTQQQLADKIGVTWEMVSRYERGTSSPMDKIYQISDALETEIRNFLDSDSDKIKKGIVILEDNLAPFFDSIPSDYIFTKEKAKLYYTVPDWILLKDKKCFVINTSFVEIRTIQIKKSGPLFIGPSILPDKDSIILAFDSKTFYIDTSSNVPQSHKFIGTVLAQEIRLV